MKGNQEEKAADKERTQERMVACQSQNCVVETRLSSAALPMLTLRTEEEVGLFLVSPSD